MVGFLAYQYMTPSGHLCLINDTNTADLVESDDTQKPLIYLKMNKAKNFKSFSMCLGVCNNSVFDFDTRRSISSLSN